MSDSSPVRIANRGLRVPLILGAGLAAVAVWGLTDSPPLNSAIGKGALEVLVVLGVIGVMSRVMGFPEDQAYVEFARNGISFGKRHLLPWEAVEAIQVGQYRTGHARIDLVPMQDWRFRGTTRRPLGWRRWPLQLSRFNRRMSTEEWMAILRTFAPSTLRVVERP